MLSNLNLSCFYVLLEQLSAKIFMQYLVDYPMGKTRVEDHLKRVVLNINYEYEEGRLSAIALVTAVVEKLPVELLEEQARLFFLPLVLQFVNDDSKDCREALSKCLSCLLIRAPIDVVQSFYDYTLRWASGTGPLQRTSLQLFGVFVDSRCDFLRTGDVASLLIDRLYDFLRYPVDDEWEIQYFSLVCLQKISASSLTALLETRFDLWVAIVDSLMNPHPWIMRVSSRIIGAQLNALDPKSFTTDTSIFLVERPGSLYQVARNLCAHLDLPEAQQDQELSTSAIKSLTWIVQAMEHHPKLCFANDQEDRNPVTWLMARLSNIAKPKGSRRRQGIFKCFAAFVVVGAPVKPYLEFILEPLHRSITEADQMMDSARHSFSRHPMEESDEVILAKDVLQVLEESCGDETEAFLRAYGAVKTRAREKRQERKNRIATEAVRDPEASAVRKMKKHEHEKSRRKRKVDECRRGRGGKAKRRHV
jgi:U3 small nucleolar RNA-associated protein 20